MGVTVSVLTKVEEVSEADLPKDQDDRWEGGYYGAYVIDPDFMQSFRGLPGSGEYPGCAWVRSVGDIWTFSQSYGGHNQFRERLTETVFGITPEAFWEQVEADPEFRDLPFFELIHFADNDGCIGPEAAADLYADFVEHRDHVLGVTPIQDGIGYDSFGKKYDQWLKAFKDVKDGGMISFG